jgi:hypothetical protein
MKLALSLVTLLLSGIAHAGITPNDALPTKILTCGGSKISAMGGRLEGDEDFSTGVSLEFKNGSQQVGYERTDAMARSRVGDHVMICLVFIPKDCPPGDERGRVYTTTNLRTLESWTLADSQHMCGGA